MKNKKALLGLAALAATAVIGGTWAYWNQDISAVNEFETGKYDTDISEEFTPPAPGEWVPGVEVEKKVKITNTGDVKVAVMATINQVWMKDENAEVPKTDEDGNIVLDEDNKPVMEKDPKAGKPCGLMIEYEKDGQTIQEYASIVDWGEEVVALDSLKDAAKGLGLQTVATLDDAKDKWVLVNVVNNTETNAGDGYSDVQFIYNGIIEPKIGETPLLVEGATLNKEVDTTVSGKTTVHAYDPEKGEGTVTATYTQGKYGYDSTKYTMTVNATTVQASAGAIKEVFGGKLLITDADDETALIESFLAGKELMVEAAETVTPQP